MKVVHPNNNGAVPVPGRSLLHQLFSNSRKFSTFLSLCALLSVTLCLPVLLVSNLNIHKNLRQMKTSIGSLALGSARSVVVRPSSARPQGRILTGNDDSLLETPDVLDDPEDDPNEVLAPPSSTEVRAPPPLPPYSLRNVLATVPRFHDTFAVLVYDPAGDKFVSHYSNDMRWISACHKLVNAMKIVGHSLRLLFPDRFAADSPEFVLAISSADFPGLKWNDCLRNQREDCFDDLEVGLAPVLHFGSVFRKAIFPTMMAMPMPGANQLSCFHYWAQHKQICEYYLPRAPGNPHGLVFPEHVGLKWEQLINQVVWRGTDFSYLRKMGPGLRYPDFEMDVASQMDLSDRMDRKSAATQSMRQAYDELIPRWKGVVWTAEAERVAEAIEREEFNRRKRNNVQANKGILVNEKRARKTQEATHERRQQERHEAEGNAQAAANNGGPALPWANIKFASAMHMGKKTPTSEIEYYQQFQEFGIPAIGEGMSLEELGKYKYHIDLGGGGGTTWSGTLEKLGLPGLLFHHVTPTKDYLHDKLLPWLHYVPVKADLSDLREKYEWAESHPRMAQRISQQATELVKSLGTPKGMEALFRQFFEHPLRQVIDAYQPLEQGVEWREAMASWGGEELRPIMQCGGYFHHHCERLAEDIDFTRAQKHSVLEASLD